MLGRCTYLFALFVQYNIRTYRTVRVFVNISFGLQLERSQPLSVLPINASRLISYDTITVTFVTTSNCNTVDNIHVLVTEFAGSNPAEAVGFFGRKNLQRAFLRRRSIAVGPMS